MYELYLLNYNRQTQKIEKTLFHDDRSATITNIVVDAQLEIEEFSAGTLDFTLPPGNVVYDKIQKMASVIQLFENGKLIWSGRPVSDDIDFWNQKKVTCEGALAFLNDSVYASKKDYTGYFKDFVGDVVSNHNTIVTMNENIDTLKCIYYDENKSHIDGGNNTITYITEYESSYETLTNFVKDQEGWAYGGFFITYEEEKPYINYMAPTNNVENYPQSLISKQTISFGKNLVDLTRSFDATDIVTVIIPLGDEVDDGTGLGTKERLTIADANLGDIRLYNNTLIEEYGRIERIVEYDGYTEAQDLLDVAKNYWQNLTYNNLELEISAVDLIFIGGSQGDMLNVSQMVRCISEPHGLDEYFRISKISKQLNDPSKTKITLTNKTEQGSNSFTKNSVSGDLSGGSGTSTTTPSSAVDKKVDNKVNQAKEELASGTNMNNMFAFPRHFVVQYMETNFDAIDAKTPAADATQTVKRNFIKIQDNKIQFIEVDTGDEKVSWEHFKINGFGVYYTDINGEDSYKYFTFTSPTIFAKADMEAEKKKAEEAGESFNQTTWEDQYKVKVWDIPDEGQSGYYVKASIEFPEKNGTGEPKIILGAGSGDTNNPMDGKVEIFKFDKGMHILYHGLVDHKEYGLTIQDDTENNKVGIFQKYAGNEFILPIMKEYASLEEAQKDTTLPLGGFAYVKQ